MLKLSPLEKEIHFLYNKHNKETLYPLEIEEIKFPLYIIKILNKAKKRTPLETKKLTAFRKKILYELKLKSSHLQYINEEEQEKKRKERQQKLAKSKDSKYENDPTKIKHFGIWFDANSNVKLNRDSYCVPSKAVHSETKKTIKYAQEFFEQNNRYPMLVSECYYTIPNDVFSDSEHYTDKWVENHYKDCMENFDLNMNFFNSLEDAPFQKHLSAFVKKKRFKEIFDLKDVSGKSGIYILVLDKYKQAYIGKSDDVKKRILQHWSAKKRFDRLIYGKVETSVLSIDSFGTLDTTRIFYKDVGWRNIDEEEGKLVTAFKADYLLNRIAGGLNGETFSSIRNLAMLASMKKRKLK